MKNIYGTRNYITEEINRNGLMSKRHQKVFTTLNYSEHFSGSSITECVSISAFAWFVGILIGITNSAIALKLCAITAAIKKY